MSDEVKIGSLVFEFDPKTRYLGIGNGEELFGTAEIGQETWDAFEAASRAQAVFNEIDGRERLEALAREFKSRGMSLNMLRSIGAENIGKVYLEVAEKLRAALAGEGEVKHLSRDKRAGEARERLATALGVHRLRETTAPPEETERLAAIELDMERALDRLDRYLQGEDYIEDWSDLAKRSHGAVHFSPPADEALPNDVRGVRGG